MNPYWQRDGLTLCHGDCLDVLVEMEPDSVDAVVTDPPAGIAFMNKEWDRAKGGRDAWIVGMAEIAAECLRVAKPGAHALVWALPRTSHWTATAWENAGWEVRDRVLHLFGQGFPKSHNLNGDWQGWGTALKPAMEDWWLLRKPLVGTVAANVQAHGVGALNVDGCRIQGQPHAGGEHAVSFYGSDGRYEPGPNVAGNPAGRWPANVVLSCTCEETRQARAPAHMPGNTKPVIQGGTGIYGKHVKLPHIGYADPDGKEAVTVHTDPDCPCAILDAQSGERPSNNCGYGEGFKASNIFGVGIGTHRSPGFGDSGGASRFFYCVKASRAERGQNNGHPTVKPLALMRWLVRLVTPPGGLICDPFLGSGTTALAARAEGFRCIGIESNEDYCRIAVSRLETPLDAALAEATE